MIKLQALHRMGACCTIRSVPKVWDPVAKETPSLYAQRRAREKVQHVVDDLGGQHDSGVAVLATSRVLAIGSRIIGPMITRQEADGLLRKLSGRTHRVYTSIALRLPKGAYWTRVCETRIGLHPLSCQEKERLACELPWNYGPIHDLFGVMGPFIRSIKENAAGSLQGVPLGPIYRLLKGHGLISLPTSLLVPKD